MLTLVYSLLSTAYAVGDLVRVGWALAPGDEYEPGRILALEDGRALVAWEGGEESWEQFASLAHWEGGACP